MGDISIKINIADRVYPLKVNMEEEEIIRRAAKLINDRIKEYQENYAVKDKQDLLSMCVLHYATTSLKAEQKLPKKFISEIVCCRISFRMPNLYC
jgi:cell division protein ZapA (FtsZ GTPase activity inhibitor)